ncbi:MAG: 7-carboxy-7-deazaguanine synthase QueE [Dysgonamonadaceae bacterium]|jgi:organic radical activating enzyme|nr:7-carboxy-7-deazaguanine synthase QueE [Dysgonamonadaceae bacterium]MDD3309500.1 7-carboxy-7-deazaguanine synthase QueE [Dysgonamonadaceae bacterium]MDD3900820.1 7-carboxy-7-deazaguanine synthase QueE [Dysgonamonadaceae bacterium]MDD4398950.1 7-carboxy-7-deazaguanine synthase QueE [Dysgonamonadaceae bacterium]MEA5081045.1 7-carboxy-7-deazaguanine synthase QueE [Dysgonamonadaceae bacterium]
MNLKVNEIFYSLQGEGGRVGEASIFIRLSGCNLNCEFCDTNFVEGEMMSLDEILNAIKYYNSHWIIWTGGEPTLQLSEKVVSFFKQKGYNQAIESNGTHPIPQGIDYKVCSPKDNYPAICALNPEVDEIRLVIAKGDIIPDISSFPKAKKYYLSPIFDEIIPVQENILYCVEQVKLHPEWALSIQLHKFIGIQ